MQITDKLSRPVIILTFAVSAFVLSIPLWMPINGHDGWIHLNWLEQFTRLFREGDLYPRWMPDSFSGFGSPAFYVYPPLTYWFASLISFVGLHSGESLFYAMSIVSVFASWATFYMYAREMQFSKYSSLIGAASYSFAPYVMIDVAIRNSLTENVAFIWVPLIFIGIERWIVGGNTTRKRTLGAALFVFATSCLLLTNIPTFIISSIASFIYILSRKCERSIVRRLLLYIVGIVFASLLTMFYIGQAINVQNYLSTSRLWSILGDVSIHRWMLGVGEEHQHFRDLFLAITLLLAMLTFALVWKMTRRHDVARSIFALSLLVIFFQVPYLADGLYNLSVLRYIQFDQRWNIILTFTTAVSIVLLVESKYRYAMEIISSSLTVAACVPVVVTVFFSNPPSREIVDNYHNDPPEYITKYVEDSAIAFPTYFGTTGMKSFIEGSDSISWKRIGSSTYEITKSAEAAVDIYIKLQYFPFWWLSQPPMDRIVLFADKSGIIRARLPKGKANYHLTQVVAGSVAYEMLSLLSLLLIVLIITTYYFKKSLLQLLRKVN